MDKIIVRSGDSEMEIDFRRFLFGDGEWVICDDCELIEDGFDSEEEAWQRYEEILTLLENK